MNKETKEVIKYLRNLAKAIEKEEIELIEIEHKVDYRSVTFDGFIVDYIDTKRRIDTFTWKAKIT